MRLSWWKNDYPKSCHIQKVKEINLNEVGFHAKMNPWTSKFKCEILRRKELYSENSAIAAFSNFCLKIEGIFLVSPIYLRYFKEKNFKHKTAIVSLTRILLKL